MNRLELPMGSPRKSLPALPARSISGWGSPRKSLPASPNISNRGSVAGSPWASPVGSFKGSPKVKSRGSPREDDGRIQVAIRCRPMNSKEKKEASSFIWNFEPTNVVELKDDGTTPTGKTMSFDHVFGPELDTQQVFAEQCSKVVCGALDGWNGTIFAYGQTSSGKTYTLMGNPETNPGIVILSIDEIFDWMSKNSHVEWATQASYIEVYNETITDLLQNDPRKGKNLKIIDDRTLGSTVKDLTEVPVMNRQYCLELIKSGERRRTYAATNMNETSSRSHTLFCLRIQGKTGSAQAKEKCVDSMASVASEFMTMQSKLTADHASLYLVDRTTNELYIQAGEITLRLPMSQGIAGAVATTGETINIADAYKDHRFNSSVDKKTGYRTKSILCMPIKGSDGQIVGVAQFINKMKGGGSDFDSSDEQLVSGLTQRLGPLISSAQANSSMSIMSRLNLVDLAGSERAGKTGASGEVLKQAGHINQSLHTLGACIAILAEGKKQHVPFRDSKLTQLLSSSLGGNSKTVLICAISPASSNRNETISTLQFASRAKKIVNHSQRNCQHDQTELVAAYEVEIAKLKAELEKRTGRRNSLMSIDLEQIYDLQSNQLNDEVTALTAEFKERLEEFECSVEEVEMLANKGFADPEIELTLSTMVASKSGQNEDAEVTVLVTCKKAGHSEEKPSGMALGCEGDKPSISIEKWITKKELLSRLDWLRKQDESGMLGTYAKGGSNAWDCAGAAVGATEYLNLSAGANEDPAISREGLDIMTRDEERKYWEEKVRKLENKLLVSDRLHMQYPNYSAVLGEEARCAVQQTSAVIKKMRERKRALARSKASISSAVLIANSLPVAGVTDDA